MTEARSDLVQGTLDLLVLSLLSREPLHGWGITRELEQRSGSVLCVNQGSLYPALERLQRRGLIRGEWRTTENNRRARYYALSAAGRRRLEAERDAWRRSVDAIDGILAWAAEGSA